MIRRSVLAVAVGGVAVVGGGCDRVFAVDEVPPLVDAPQEIVDYDRCAPTEADPLRYTSISSPTEQAWSWAEARTQCMRRGMDLAVMNDPHELGSIEGEARPIWLGASYDGSAWSSIDGCPAFPQTMVAPGGGAQCGFSGADGTTIHGGACNGDFGIDPDSMEPIRARAAMCEAPRAPQGGCGLKPPSEETYVLSEAPMTYAGAHDFCAKQGGHLVVIDSHEELTFISNLASEGTYPRAWIGATFDRRTWKSVTQCPGLYTWAGGFPLFDVSTDCLATTMLPPDPENPSLLPVFDGMTPTRCDAPEIRALCEVGD